MFSGVGICVLSPIVSYFIGATGWKQVLHGLYAGGIAYVGAVAASAVWETVKSPVMLDREREQENQKLSQELNSLKSHDPINIHREETVREFVSASTDAEQTALKCLLDRLDTPAADLNVTNDWIAKAVGLGLILEMRELGWKQYGWGNERSVKVTIRYRVNPDFKTALEKSLY